MYINDDADSETVVRITLEALNECKRHIGKADRGYSDEQIQEIELAIIDLQKTIDRKRA